MHIIKGYYRNESGDLSIGTLMIDNAAGKFCDAEGGFPLRASRYAVTADTAGIEITSPQSVIQFLPDAGEVERIGMPVVGL